VAKSNRIAQLMSALPQEERLLGAQLGKVRDAIASLGGVSREYRVRQGLRKTKTVARNARKMTAAQRKAVGQHML